MTTIRTKKIGNNHYEYEQRSVRVGDKVKTEHVRYIGKSDIQYISRSGNISDKPTPNSVRFEKKNYKLNNKIITDKKLNPKQEEKLEKIYKHYSIIQPKDENVESIKKPYYFYNPLTSKKEQFYTREEADERAISIREQNDLEYKPMINKEQ